MRNIMLFLFLVLAPISSYGQVGFDSVYQIIPNYPNDMHALVVDDDTLVVAQSLYDTLNQVWSINLLKLDTFGNILYSNLLVDPLGFSYIRSQGGNKIIKTADGGYAYGASYAHNPDCKECIFFVKYKHSGAIDFVKYYAPPDTTALIFAVNNLLQLDDGGYFLFAFYELGAKSIPYLIRTDAQGNELWSRDYAAPGDTAVVFFDVLSLSSNKFVTSGTKHQFAPGYEYIFIEPCIYVLDSLGNVLQEVPADADSLLTASFVATADGGYLQTVEKVTQFHPYYKSLGGIRKLDADFNEEWVRYVDYDPISIPYLDIIQTTDGNYVASGARGTTGTGKPAMHIKIKEDGTVLWERFDFSHYGNTVGETTIAKASAVLSSGSIVSVGSTIIAEPYGFSEKGWLVKISPGGCIDDTDTLDCWAGATVVSNQEVVHDVAAIEVYPNPTYAELTIVLPGGLSKGVTVYFYDMTGRLLHKQALKQVVNHLTVSDLPRGMIFYDIVSAQGVLKSGKLVKME